MRHIPKVKIPRVSSRRLPQNPSMLLVLDLPDERAALAAAKEKKWLSTLEARLP